jgi:carboxypeptidase family protein
MLCAGPLRAQEVGGALEGRVVDATGAPRAQVLVTVEGPALLGPRAARTDERGRFRFAALPVGRCTLALALLGYHPLREEVAIELGRTSDLGDLTLQTEAIPVSGTTVTAAKRPRLDPSSTWIGGRLDVGAMRALPVDRDYQSVVTLLPHANESYAGDRANLLGTTGAETKYYVDGVNTVEPPGNALSTSIPYNFLQEVEVRAGGYEAEFGGAGGGIVNAVTVTGGNQFHAQVFGFYGSRLLTSTSGVLAVSEKTSTFASWDAGFTLGGPIRRDRMWYSLAYNPAGECERIRLAGTPALDDRRLAHRFAGKLTWRADDRTSVSLAVLGDPGDRDQVGGVVLSKLVTIGNLDPVLGDQRGGGANVSLQAMRLLGASAFLDARITRSDSRYSLVPQTARGRSEPLYLDARTGFVEGGVGSFVERYAGRTTAHAQLAVTRSGHLMKGGIEYEDEFFGEDYDIDQITRLGDSLYQVVTLRNRHSQNHLRVPTAFLQDTWQAAGGLRLRLGLRWAGEYWMTSGGDVGQRILDGWQPRTGFVWQPRVEGNLKLFGSGGRFVQQTRLNVPQFFQQDVPSLYLVQLFDHDPRVDPSGGSTAFAQVLGRQAEVDRLRGATFDEYQLGGEWLAVGGWAAGLRGVIRTQRSAIVGVLSPLTGQAVYGNPGRGELAAYPEVAREYQALELTLAHADSSGVARLGYVLSRNRGNYEGYWDQTAAQNDPLGGAAFAPSFSTSANASGFLPDDRTHVLKLQLSRSLGRTFEAGATLVWESGTPLGELGATPFGAPYYEFLSPRGSQGRSPALYDLNLRLAHEARWLAAGRGAPRLMLDVYHVGNPRKPVAVDQVHYRGVQSGQQVAPNPSYQRALLAQPPVAYRFGCELRW